MDIQERDDRFFGIFGLILAVCGLTLPFALSEVIGEEHAMVFAVITLVLALIFSIIGRRSKPGHVGLVMTTIILGITLLIFAMMVG